MHRYRPKLPSDLETTFGSVDNVVYSDPAGVATYEDLVTTVARIAHRNPRIILLFRGQGRDYRKRGEASTFYPTIYRGDQVPTAEILERFSRLEQAESDLINLADRRRIEGAPDIRRRQLVRWGILQHYEVCATPLLDFTHSLSVACSFAQSAAPKDAEAVFVYAFAFPYLTNRISYNSEEDLVTVRLLSIAPPGALRPYFQEGYLAGTTDVTNDFPDKSELDFNRRLVAKFAIPIDGGFWRSGPGAIPPALLRPSDDDFLDLVAGISDSSIAAMTPGSLGEFMVRWQAIERGLFHAANEFEAKLRSPYQAIRVLGESGAISKDVLRQLDSLRRFRNLVVHRAEPTTEAEIRDRVLLADDVLAHLRELGLAEDIGPA